MKNTWETPNEGVNEKNTGVNEENTGENTGENTVEKKNTPTSITEGDVERKEGDAGGEEVEKIKEQWAKWEAIWDSQDKLDEQKNISPEEIDELLAITKSEKETNLKQEFKIGDRVKCWHRDKWWSGTIIDFPPRQVKVTRTFFKMLTECGIDLTILEEDDRYVTYEDPTRKKMLVKTDERVRDDPDAYLDGYGINGPVGGPFNIFEDDPEPDTSDSIFWNR